MCECLLPDHCVKFLTHDQHVAFHAGDVDGMEEAIGFLVELGFGEDELEAVAQANGLEAN